MTEGSSEQGRGIGGTSAGAAAWLAGALCLLSVVLLTCSVVFAVLNHEDPEELTYLIGVFSCALVGGLVASRRPYNPVGWFLLGSAVSFTLQHFTGQYATYGLLTAPGSLPVAPAMAWPQTFLYVPGVFLILCFLPLYFPDGRLLSPRWRPVLWIVVLVSVVLLVSLRRSLRVRWGTIPLSPTRSGSRCCDRSSACWMPSCWCLVPLSSSPRQPAWWFGSGAPRVRNGAKWSG